MLPEHEFRIALREHFGPVLASLQPSADLLDSLWRRRRRRRQRAAALSLAAVAAAAALGTTIVTTWTSQANRSTVSRLNTSPLVSSGDCAGLSVSAMAADKSIAFRPGDSGDLSVAVGSSVVLIARGPCADGSLLVGIAGGVVVSEQGSGRFGGSFSSGTVHLTASKPGKETVWLQFGCPNGEKCIDTVDPQLATMTITVVPRGG